MMPGRIIIIATINHYCRWGRLQRPSWRAFGSPPPPLAPSPPYFGLILASVGKLSSFLSHGCQSTTPSQELSEEDSDEEISSMVRNLSYHETVKSVSHSQLLAGADRLTHSGSSLESHELPGQGDAK